MNILYIGNKLQKHGKTPTSIETLGKKFNEIGQVKYASEYNNLILRFFDMLFRIIKNKKWIDLLL